MHGYNVGNNVTDEVGGGVTHIVGLPNALGLGRVGPHQ